VSHKHGQPIPPEVETRVEGTNFVVWHDDHVARFVHVLSDGAIDLPEGCNWIVAPAPSAAALEPLPDGSTRP
jgi:hypothetical protein